MTVDSRFSDGTRAAILIVVTIAAAISASFVTSSARLVNVGVSLVMFGGWVAAGVALVIGRRVLKDELELTHRERGRALVGVVGGMLFFVLPLLIPISFVWDWAQSVGVFSGRP